MAKMANGRERMGRTAGMKASGGKLGKDIPTPVGMPEEAGIATSASRYEMGVKKGPSVESRPLPSRAKK